MSTGKREALLLVLVLGVMGLAGVGIWQTRGIERPVLVQFTHQPWGIMGTDTRLHAVVPADFSEEAEEGLRLAEKALRDVQMRMDPRLYGSEIHLINTAEPGEFVPLSPETAEVLLLCRDLYDQTGGAFDVTVGGLLQAWSAARDEHRMPTSDELLAARDASNWAGVAVVPTGAVNHTGTVQFDLGGIAKGYGIDRAVVALQRIGCHGGLVDVGGDLRCFGEPPQRTHWTVAVRNPFADEAGEPLAYLKLNDAAVCTSGNYQRFYEIEGVRYSHIIDPRPGPRMGQALEPDVTPASVTVIAPTTAVADAWATALSVLGPEGLGLLPEASGIEAMIVTGTPDKPQYVWTPGFAPFFLDAPPPGGRVWTAQAGASPRPRRNAADGRADHESPLADGGFAPFALRPPAPRGGGER